jgi:hypothetical protein
MTHGFAPLSINAGVSGRSVALDVTLWRYEHYSQLRAWVWPGGK